LSRHFCFCHDTSVCHSTSVCLCRMTLSVFDIFENLFSGKQVTYSN
jgi:hypothetical protein